MTERNWAGNLQYTAATLAEPASVTELQKLVARSPRVRALGTRHSFSDIADTTGTLVSTARLPNEVGVDTSKNVARISAATRYGVAASAIAQAGRSLHNLGSLPHISVAGAISTGTHGSGTSNGILATAVEAIELVGAAGQEVRIERGDKEFNGAVVGLGAVGVVTSVELALGEHFDVHQEAWYETPWSALLDDPRTLFNSAYSVSVLTHFGSSHLEHVWLKSEVRNDARLPAVTGARRRDPDAVMDANLTEFGSAGPWDQRLPHFRLDMIPSRGDELQSEYYVGLDQARAAVDVLRGLADDIDPILAISELRTVAPDDFWLSGAFERESLSIGFTWKPDAVAVAAATRKIEAALAPLHARPHWGKLHGFRSDDLARVFPRYLDAGELFRRRDPDGKFANAYLIRVGLR